MFGFFTSPTTQTILQNHNLVQELDKVKSEAIDIRVKYDKLKEDNNRLSDELTKSSHSVKVKDNEISVLESKITLIKDFHNEQLELINRLHANEISSITSRQQDEIAALKTLQSNALGTLENNYNDRINSVKDSYDYKIRKIKDAVETERESQQILSDAEYEKARAKWLKDWYDDRYRNTISWFKDLLDVLKSTAPESIKIPELIESISKLIVTPAPVNVTNVNGTTN